MCYRQYLTAAAIALMSVGTGSSLDSAVRLARPGQDLAVAIRDTVETASGPVAAQAQLIGLYSAGQYAPLWLDPSGRPTDDAQRARDRSSHTHAPLVHGPVWQALLWMIGDSPAGRNSAAAKRPKRWSPRSRGKV